MNLPKTVCFMHGDGIRRIRASTACSSSSICWSRCSLEMERSKQRIPWEWRRGSTAYTLAASSSRRVNTVRVRTVPVWPRVWRGRPGSSGTMRSSARGWHGDRGRARGGGDDRHRAGWRRCPRCGGPSGVGVGGEESAKNARKKMAVVYICHAPLLPVPSPHRK